MIRFSQQNFVHGTEEVVNKLRNDGLGNSIDIEPEGESFEAPYAYVDNKLVVGDTPKELYNRIKNEIKE